MKKDIITKTLLAIVAVLLVLNLLGKFPPLERVAHAQQEYRQVLNSMNQKLENLVYLKNLTSIACSSDGSVVYIVETNPNGVEMFRSKNYGDERSWLKVRSVK